MTIALVVFGAAYFTLVLRPTLGVHGSPSILTVILLGGLPLLWLWGMRTRRKGFCLVLVPLGLILGGDIDGYIDPAPMTAVLQVVVSVAYIFVTGHYVSGANAAIDSVDTEWIQTVPERRRAQHWGVLPIAIALILGILSILGFPELLVPEGHRWIEYRSRIQAVLILCLGVHSALLLERLNRQHVNWSVETPRFLGGVMGFGLFAALILESMDS